MTAAGSDTGHAGGLAGRVALVTGGSGGIGAAIVRQLAAAGAAVAVGYGQHGEAAEKTAAQIVSAGGRAVALGADLRDPAAPWSAGQGAEDALGPVDVLVSNAGLGGTKTLGGGDRRRLRRDAGGQPAGPVPAGPADPPGHGGPRVRADPVRVVGGRVGTGGIVGPHYAASKAGLNGLTHFLASRYAPAGVTVNGLAPALVTETGMLPGDPEELRRQVPGRPGQAGGGRGPGPGHPAQRLPHQPGRFPRRRHVPPLAAPGGPGRSGPSSGPVRAGARLTYHRSGAGGTCGRTGHCTCTRSVICHWPARSFIRGPGTAARGERRPGSWLTGRRARAPRPA